MFVSLCVRAGVRVCVCVEIDSCEGGGAILVCWYDARCPQKCDTIICVRSAHCATAHAQHTRTTRVIRRMRATVALRHVVVKISQPLPQPQPKGENPFKCMRSVCITYVKLESNQSWLNLV